MTMTPQETTHGVMDQFNERDLILEKHKLIRTNEEGISMTSYCQTGFVDSLSARDQ